MEANDTYPMITLYRAKKLNSEEYIIGYLSRIKNQLIIDENQNVWEYFIEPERNLINVNSLTDDNIANVTKNIYAIDNSTLSIHFEDMVDSKKKRIFASLNKTGKGGDILKNRYSSYTVKLDKESCTIKRKPNFFAYWENIKEANNYFFNNAEIIGIKE